MILEKQTEGLILEEGAISDSTMMEIDADSHIFLMRMLSKFYSDAIGSLIRETASNALDSHRQSGSTEPIIVSLKKINGNVEFSVEDFGMGIDDHIVNTVIRMYGKSTKRQSANQLGAFGLGFKSPLAYGPSFYFVGRKNGVERKWMMYEAEDEQNKIDLLYEKPTTEKNGVKIIVSVKYYDYNNFLTKIREQLAYFEGVYFDCDSAIDNDFSIVRSEHFQWSPLNTDYEMHICLDNVYYPIDWSKLGIPPINLPIGLRFSLTDGIFPLPNREAIKYTEECKNAIKKKITLISDYFIEKYNSEVTEKESIETIFEYFSHGYKNITGFKEDTKWDITPLGKYSTKAFKDPTLKGVKILDLRRLYTMKDSFAKLYRKAYTLANGRFSDVGTSRWNQEMSYYDMSKPVYVFKETLTKTKKDYYRQILNRKSAVFVKLNPDMPLKGKLATESSYFHVLNLKAYPKDQWRQIIKEYQYVRDLVSKHFVDVDKFEIPKDWFEARKKVKAQVIAANDGTVRRKKLVGESTGKEAKDLERYVSAKNCKFETVVIKMAEAHKYPKMTIYAENTEKNEAKFQKLFTIVDKKKVRLVTFSSREMKNLKDVKLHNWISMEEFEKGDHKVYRRLVTAYLINELMKNNYNTFVRKEVLDSISKDLKSKLTDLVNYKNLYFTNGTEALYKEMLAVAEDKQLFDPSIYPLYKEVKKTLEKLPFLNSILKLHPSYGALETPVVDALKDLFKYYKMRIDWIHYKVVLNEEPVVELTEETVEQLEETI
jgi:hypothetical protein